MRNQIIPPAVEGLNRLLDYRQSAAYIGMSISYLEGHRHEIGYYSFGRRVLFRLSDLDSWLEGRKVQPQQDALRSLVDELVSQITLEDADN